LRTLGLPDALVADANVVLSAVFGGQSSRAFGDPSLPLTYGAVAVRQEILEWLPKIAERRRLDLGLRLGLLQLLPIKWIEANEYVRHESDARERMRSRDLDDWPSVALTLALAESRRVAIWTNDKDFAVSGLETVTTAQLLLRLERRSRP
jgi:predicted nucleic acid-binding protein